MIKVGDIVRRPLNYGELFPKIYQGTVVYVHPDGIFHMVEFEFKLGRKVRECYWGEIPDAKEPKPRCGFPRIKEIKD